MIDTLTANGTLVLPPILDLRSADTLKAALVSARGQALTIDASEVERIGGIGLQILLSAIRTWKADAQPLAFVNVAEEFSQQWQSFGAPLNDLAVQDATA